MSRSFPDSLLQDFLASSSILPAKNQLFREQSIEVKPQKKELPPAITFPLKQPHFLLEQRFLSSFLDHPKKREQFQTLLKSSYPDFPGDETWHPLLLRFFYHQSIKYPTKDYSSFFRSLCCTCFKKEYRALKRYPTITPLILNEVSAEFPDPEATALLLFFLSPVLGIPTEFPSDIPVPVPDWHRSAMRSPSKWRTLKNLENLFFSFFVSSPFRSLLSESSRENRIHLLSESVLWQEELSIDSPITFAESQKITFFLHLIRTFEEREEALLSLLLCNCKKTDTSTEEEITDRMSDRKRIQELTLELKQEKTISQELRSGLLEKTKTEKELTSQLQKEKENRKELAALRNHLYRFTEAEDLTETESVSEEEIEAFLSGKKILIIGGHSNWVYKLRNKFKSWIFIDPKNTNTIPDRLLNSADYIFFFTDIIAHSTYSRFVRCAREKKLPYGYLHSVNIPSNIRQIYTEVTEQNS